jgi:DNA-binding SARP family transcriptional activator/tetratricopeptide (TPR) repeat protein
VKRERRLVLTLLGGFDARAESGAPLALPTRKARALLAFLALPVGRTHSRERLATLLWGDMPDAQARGNLRQALSRIQRGWAGVAAPGLRFQGDAVALDPAVVEVDVAAFEALLADGRPEALARAVERYGGDLLDGFALSEPGFEEWLTVERERLRELAATALGRLLDHQRTTRHDHRVLRTARRLLELDPLHESAHRLVMQVLWQRGDRAAALRQYQLCVDALRRELRAEPAAETRHLYEEILRPRPAVVRPRAARATEPATPLVGRERELATVCTVLDQVGGGDGRAVALVGEAGIGKSRLLNELATLAVRRGMRVLSARAHEAEQVLPFAPWVDALRADGVVEDPAVLRELTPALRGDLARVIPELGDGSRRSASRTNLLRVFTALARLVAVAGAGRPVVIALDDVHWADDTSVRLLAFLARRLEGSSTLLTVAARAEALPDAPLLRRTLDELSNESLLLRAELGPLSDDEILRLAREALDPAVDAQSRDRVAAHAGRLAEGNPFVALEAVRAWRADDAPSAVAPQRVRRSILDQLERLDERARVVAGVAAVAGPSADVAVVLRSSGLDEDDAVAGLESLLRHEILRRDGAGLEFGHARVLAVAAEVLSAPRRAIVHRRIAESLEALSAPERPSALALGRHYRGAEVWDKAIDHLRTAGRRAAERAEYTEAAAAYAEAAEVCGRLGAGREAALVTADVRLELGSTLHNLGDVPGALEHYASAETVTSALSLAAMSYAHTSTGRHRTAVELAHRALASSADPALRRWVWHSLVRTAYAAGDYRTASSMADATLRDPEAPRSDAPFALALLTPVVPAVGVRGFVALALSALGHFDDAVARATEAAQLADHVNRSPELAWASFCLGHTLLERGEPGVALEYLERAFALTREWEPSRRRPPGGPRALAAVAAATLALARAATGQVASAVGLAAVGATTVSARPFGLAPLLELQGRVLVLAGRLDEAASVADAAVEAARAQAERGHEARALRLVTEVAVRQHPDSIESVLGPLTRAMALADELHMQPLAAWCRRALAGERSGSLRETSHDRSSSRL